MAWNSIQPNFRQYNNFDDLYYGLLDEMINTGVQYQDSCDGMVENLFISCKSYDCTLQPRQALFKPVSRWKYLCSRYLDYDKWSMFTRDLSNKKLPQSRTFRFKKNNKEILGDDVKRVKNGPCLISMTISYNDNMPTKKYNRVDIVFRNSEVETKLLYDLILINRLLNDISKYDCVDIKTINFHMFTCFVSTHYLAAMMSLNMYPERFFGDNSDFKVNESIINYSLKHLDDDLEKTKISNRFDYETIRRYRKYYDPHGQLSPLKLVKFHKLVYDQVYENRHKYIKINYDYLQLDGSYDKIIIDKPNNKELNKLTLW